MQRRGAQPEGRLQRAAVVGFGSTNRHQPEPSSSRAANGSTNKLIRNRDYVSSRQVDQESRAYSSAIASIFAKNLSPGFEPTPSLLGMDETVEWRIEAVKLLTELHAVQRLLSWKESDAGESCNAKR